MDDREQLEGGELFNTPPNLVRLNIRERHHNGVARVWEVSKPRAGLVAEIDIDRPRRVGLEVPPRGLITRDDETHPRVRRRSGTPPDRILQALLCNPHRFRHPIDAVAVDVKLGGADTRTQHIDHRGADDRGLIAIGDVLVDGIDLARRHCWSHTSSA